MCVCVFFFFLFFGFFCFCLVWFGFFSGMGYVVTYWQRILGDSALNLFSLFLLNEH